MAVVVGGDAVNEYEWARAARWPKLPINNIDKPLFVLNVNISIKSLGQLVAVRSVELNWTEWIRGHR